METIAYGVTNFEHATEGYGITGLKIQLGIDHPLEIVLPALEVGPPDGQKDTIFYLDVSAQETLMKAAAETLAEFILAQPDITTIITPQSHKSIPCMAEAVRIAREKSDRDIAFIVLLGGKEESSVNEGAPGHTVFYTPITTPEGKWASITQDDLTLLLEHSPTPDTVMVMDDVYSKGGTFAGVFTLLNGIYPVEETQTYTSAVIAVEQPIYALDIAAIPSYMHAAMIIPEIPGQVDTG